MSRIGGSSARVGGSSSAASNNKFSGASSSAVSAAITLGIRSSHGRKKLTLPGSSSLATLKAKIRELLELTEDFQVRTDKNGRPGEEIAKLSGRLASGTICGTLKLKTGDCLYITPIAGTRFVDSEADLDEEAHAAGEPTKSSSSSSGSAPSSLSTASSSSSLLQKQPPSLRPSSSSSKLPSNTNEPEDLVDVELAKLDGQIRVDRTPNCNHKSGAACIYCTPKDPYDPEHLKREGIKFMSFHSYLRKLKAEKGKYATLEDIDLSIKPGCTNHAPWPVSICSACQPPALTLNRQTYRHVDNVIFENPGIVDRFLSFWRTTGNQRAGILYGRFETFLEVPLGIKAVVCAIYEPPQESSRDYIRFLNDDSEGKNNEDKVEEIAKHLGLQRVGWIFTDLVSNSKGNIRHFRNADSHFLSAQECITAGHLQNCWPNITGKSSTGRHGSKQVTIVVTGNCEGQVHMEGYQVSNQCMAMVKNDVLVPTKDAPELGYVRESSSAKYVPDVFYKLKDEYGNEVTKVARPLPVEYLLIDVPVAAPLEPLRTFNPDPKKPAFPIENRPIEGHLQDFPALANQRKAFAHEHMADFFRDFHLLVYLATQTVHPLDVSSDMKTLLEALRGNRPEAVFQWVESGHWHTMEMLIQNYNDGYQ